MIDHRFENSGPDAPPPTALDHLLSALAEKTKPDVVIAGSPKTTLRGACGSSLNTARRAISRAMLALAGIEMHLPPDERLAAGMLSEVEAERIERYCLNLKVSLLEMQKWSALLLAAANSATSNGVSAPACNQPAS